MAYALYLTGKSNPELNVLDDLLQSPQSYAGTAGFGALTFALMSKWGYDMIGHRLMSMKRFALITTGLFPLLALSLWNDPTQLYRLTDQSLWVTFQGSLHALGQTPYLAVVIVALYLARPRQMNSLFTRLIPFTIRAHLHYASGSMDELLNRYRLSMGLINIRDFVGKNTSALFRWAVGLIAGVVGWLVALEVLRVLGYSAHGWEMGMYLWHMATHAWEAMIFAITLDVGGMFSAMNAFREAFEGLIMPFLFDSTGVSSGVIIRITVTTLASLVAITYSKHLYVKAINKLARAIDAVVLPQGEDLKIEGSTKRIEATEPSV
jgi:hypothetical protein